MKKWWEEIGHVDGKVRLVRIGPELARGWLENRNDRNRKIKKDAVARISSDIREGRFILNGETIIFDADGQLLSGQHRLKAVVETGATIASYVAFDMPVNAMGKTDRGIPKSADQFLQIAGKSHATRMAAAAKLAMQAEKGAKGENISTCAILEWIERHPEIEPCVIAAQSIYTSGHKAGFRLNPAASAVALWLANRRDLGELMTDMLSDTCRGVGLEEGSSTLLLRNYIANARDRKIEMSAWEVLNTIIDAFTKRGKNAKHLRPTLGTALNQLK